MAVRVVVFNGPKFMALPFGTHELTFDLLRSKGSGQKEQEGGSTGGPRLGDTVVSFGKWVPVCAGTGGGSEFCPCPAGVISGTVRWRSLGPACPGKV